MRGNRSDVVHVRYFDSCDPFVESGVADVDRVYRFAWHKFAKSDWEELGRVYARLPGWRGYVPIRSPGWRGLLGQAGAFPFWFGDDAHGYPHLTVSVEPPGLQVTGSVFAAATDFHHMRFVCFFTVLATVLTPLFRRTVARAMLTRVRCIVSHGGLLQLLRRFNWGEVHNYARPD